MQVRVRYFAALRATAGVDRETVEFAGGDVAALYALLRERHGFAFAPAALRVAVDDALVGWQHALADGQEVVFLPPFSGG